MDDFNDFLNKWNKLQHAFQQPFQTYRLQYSKPNYAKKVEYEKNFRKINSEIKEIKEIDKSSQDNQKIIIEKLNVIETKIDQLEYASIYKSLDQLTTIKKKTIN